MYSLILMAAVATTSDSVSFHKRASSCQGCCGVPVMVYSPPVIYSVGCYGSATPIGCSGCYGCSGCMGFVPYSASCFGSSCFGSGWSCSGCCGGGCCGGVIWSVPTVAVPAIPMTQPAPAPTPPVPMETAEPKSASITIELPGDAQLVVDGNPINGQGTVRTFTTPALPTDKPFYYDMNARIERDGKIIDQNLRIVVRGGENLKKSFGELIAQAQNKPSAEVAQK